MELGSLRHDIFSHFDELDQKEPTVCKAMVCRIHHISKHLYRSSHNQGRQVLLPLDFVYFDFAGLS